MNTDEYLRILKTNVEAKNSDEESVLTLLYEAYSDVNRLDDEIINKDFDELYRLMNGLPLRDMDKIIYPVCTLCREHERSGFIHGIRVGVRLVQELI